MIVQKNKKRLVPCPRCGDISLYVSDGDYYSGYESYGYRVSCKCHYAWKAVPWFSTKEEAIEKWEAAAEAWNRRANDLGDLIKEAESEMLCDYDDQIEQGRYDEID